VQKVAAMRTQTFKLIGLFLTFSLFSGCGILNKKSNSSDSQNNEDELTIQGTTSWLIDVMVPSSYAQENIIDTPMDAPSCPDGFYVSPLEATVTSAPTADLGEVNTKPTENTPETDTVASEPTVTNSSSACPNNLTSCVSESGTCAFLYSISETEGKNLICTVPVDKHNHYEFKFTENPGITGGQIVITSVGASTLIFPDSCMAQNGMVERKHTLLDKLSKYECLPNPVEYREITFEVNDKKIVANADPTATLESGYNATILQTPSKTLKEQYKKAKEIALEEIKKKTGGKIDFNDESMIDQFSNAKVAEEQLNGIVMGSPDLDLEKIKIEIDSKMALDKIEGPEKLAHYQKNNNFIKDLARKKAEDISTQLSTPETDAEIEKLTTILDEIDSKTTDMREKALDLQFDAVKDPTKIDKKKQKKIAEVISTIDGGFLAIAPVYKSPDTRIRAIAEISTETNSCSVDEQMSQEPFDLNTHITNMENAFNQMVKAKMEKQQQVKVAVEDTNQRFQLILQMAYKGLSTDQPTQELLKAISDIEQKLLAVFEQRNKLNNLASEMNMIDVVTKKQYDESHLKAQQMALKELQAIIDKTTVAEDLKKLNLAATEINSKIVEGMKVLITDDQSIKTRELENKSRNLNSKLKSIMEMKEYYTTKSKSMNVWILKDSKLSLSDQITEADTKIKTLQADQVKTERDLKAADQALKDYLLSLEQSKVA